MKETEPVLVPVVVQMPLTLVLPVEPAATAVSRSVIARLLGVVPPVADREFPLTVKPVLSTEPRPTATADEVIVALLLLTVTQKP